MAEELPPREEGEAGVLSRASPWTLLQDGIWSRATAEAEFACMTVRIDRLLQAKASLLWQSAHSRPLLWPGQGPLPGEGEEVQEAVLLGTPAA